MRNTIIPAIKKLLGAAIREHHVVKYDKTTWWAFVLHVKSVLRVLLMMFYFVLFPEQVICTIAVLK